MSAAAIYDTFEGIDVMSQPAIVEVLGRNLREGMVLVDELGCPSAGLDHQAGRASHGARPWLVANLDFGGWATIRLSQNHAFRVMAR